MSSTMFQSRQRKNFQPFGGVTPTLGRKFYEVLFFVYSTAIFEVATAFGQKKK
jgi:hypothetical protein